MHFFDFFKKRKLICSYDSEVDEIAIPDSEKVFYQPDDYYKNVTYLGTAFERRVISFRERKETAIASEHGLYVPEILMLHYSTKYPNPENGYPGYWWFQYGIRNVGAVYNTLVEKGFLKINDETKKYQLTELGDTELISNAYVHYTHSHSKDVRFTAWDANKLLIKGTDKQNYKMIIDDILGKLDLDAMRNENEFIKNLNNSDLVESIELKKQDQQLKKLQAADRKYKQDKDLNWIINFWEDIWNNGGLTFEGSYWIFRLPDLYIKAKRYDAALAFVNKIKQQKGEAYVDKVNKYIEKINECNKRQLHSKN